MKHLILSCLVLVSLNVLTAQKLTEGTCALTAFTNIVSDDYYKSLDKIELYTYAEKFTFEKVKKRVKQILSDATFKEIQKVFKEKHGITISKDQLEGKAFYDKMGYPNISFKKAAKKGKSNYYFSFRVFFSNKISLGGTLLNSKQIKPEISITMSVANSKGQKIYKKIKGKAKVEDAIKAKDMTGAGRVDFTNIDSADILTKPLIELMQKAVFDLADNFNPAQ